LRLILLLREIIGSRRILILGIGGGGDSVGSLLTYRLATREGIAVVLGSVLWERFIVDPVPGPIGIDELVNSKPLGHNIALVNGSTYALRGGRVVKPQLSAVLGTLGEEGLGVSLKGSVAEISEEIVRYITESDIGAVVGIDVGGDSLAIGCEEGLGSPLVDSYSLAVLARVKDKLGIPVILGIAGPGVDGELSRDYVLMRISQAARKGAYLGAVGLGGEELSIAKRALVSTVTEASRLFVSAAEGYYGEFEIRGGLRRVKLDISMSITYYLDLEAILDELPMVHIVMDSRDPWDAMGRLNSEGIYTELNMEMGVHEFYLRHGKLPNTEELARIIREIRDSLGECKLRFIST